MIYFFQKNQMKILLTGPPGVGKTSLVKLLSEQLDCAGFYTEEVRDGRNKRTGFDIVVVGSGQRGTLARLDSTVKGPRVGQYTVTLAEFESLALPSLSLHRCESAKVLVIDEIGKMESFSGRFSSLVRQVFSGDHYQGDIVATIPSKFDSLSLVKEIVSRGDTELIEVTKSNRDELRTVLLEKLSP